MEARLHAAVHSDDPLVTEVAGHLMDAGGKRFRPLLVAVAAHFGDPEAARSSDAAAVVELTHLATLYHDDVMDEAQVRRGRGERQRRWGNSIAILVGDFLFARAADLAADLGPEAVRIQAAHLRPAGARPDRRDGRPARRGTRSHHYLHVIAEQDRLADRHVRPVRRAVRRSRPRPQVEALANYGELMGIAFQLSDDLLDIASDSDQSGKTPGTDLREGVPTLPVLYALASDDRDPDAVRLREILAAGPVTDDALHAEALALLRDSAALKQARETVRGYAEQARAQLAALPDVGPGSRWSRSVTSSPTAPADRRPLPGPGAGGSTSPHRVCQHTRRVTGAETERSQSRADFIWCTRPMLKGSAPWEVRCGIRRRSPLT